MCQSERSTHLKVRYFPGLKSQNLQNMKSAISELSLFKKEKKNLFESTKKICDIRKKCLMVHCLSGIHSYAFLCTRMIMNFFFFKSINRFRFYKISQLFLLESLVSGRKILLLNFLNEKEKKKAFYFLSSESKNAHLLSSHCNETQRIDPASCLCFPNITTVQSIYKWK